MYTNLEAWDTVREMVLPCDIFIYVSVMYTNLETWDTVREGAILNVITTVLQETFCRWDTASGITTVVLQETFYRVTDLYIGVVNIFLPRDLKSLQLKYILETRYYAILRNF